MWQLSRAAITSVLILLACGALQGFSSVAEITLADLAASMQPGTWAELVQTNINSALGQGNSTGNRLPYGFSAVWDPVRNQLQFTGSDHHDTPPGTKHISYDGATNNWTVHGVIVGIAGSHGYDHNTIDPSTGIVYVREYGIYPGGNRIWSYAPGGAWSARTSWPIERYINVANGIDWWTGRLNRVGSQGALIVYNCGGAEIKIWDPQNNRWLGSANSFKGSSTYHCFIEYSAVHNVAVFGGGNADRRKVWRLNSDRTVTALSDAPLDLGVQGANVVPDPFTGNFLVLGSGQFWEFDPRASGTWRQLSAPPSAVGNPGGPNLDGVISAAISNYGVVTYITCRASNCNMYLYKHTSGQQTTLPQTTSALASRTFDSVAASPQPSDFTTRCAASAVLKCVGFDQSSEIAGTYGDNSGILPGTATPELDSSVKASGDSALKFTIPSNSGANSSGSYFTNFSDDLSVQFGENSEFYVQWRQRFSPEFINTQYQGGGGWKQSIIGTGDKPGCTSSTSANGQCYASCTTLETVTQNTFQRGFAQMYNSCTGSSSHGPYSPFEQSFGAYDFKLQNARPGRNCLYSQGHTKPPSYLPPAGNCFGYFPNEWMTFQVRIKTGPRVNDEFTNSFVELWIAREGQPSVQVMNWGPYGLSAGSATENQRFGKVWLLPYHTGKSPSQTHPTAYTWYDELIVSRTRISDPKNNSYAQ